MTIEICMDAVMRNESKADCIIKKADDHSKMWINILPMRKAYHSMEKHVPSQELRLACKSLETYFSVWVSEDVDPL